MPVDICRWGNNGDSFDETIFGPHMSTDGSYFQLFDDSSVERKANSVSFVLSHNDENNKQIVAAKLYICKG